ncbi:MAG: InlB B-repeat-containing protein, partial [Firmicutes bacterium]|nr:InlB B-repeat-containing protein [Bacillota bacterium]
MVAGILNNDVPDYDRLPGGNHMAFENMPSTMWNDAANIAPGFAGGTGTAANPWRIHTPEQLARFGHLVNTQAAARSQHFLIERHLNMGAHRWFPVAHNQNIAFTGSISGIISPVTNGSRVTISNLRMNTAQAFIGYAANNARIGRATPEMGGHVFFSGIDFVRLEVDTNLQTSSFIVGRTAGSGPIGVDISNISIDSTSTLISRYNGTLSSIHGVGGIIGTVGSSNFPVNISKVDMNGTVGNTQGNNAVGGIIGFLRTDNLTTNITDVNVGGNISSSVNNTVAVSGANHAGGVGGFVGEMGASNMSANVLNITNSTVTATGNISATNLNNKPVGGFVGRLSTGLGQNAVTVNFNNATLRGAVNNTMRAGITAGSVAGFVGHVEGSGGVSVANRRIDVRNSLIAPTATVTAGSGVTSAGGIVGSAINGQGGNANNVGLEIVVRDTTIGGTINGVQTSGSHAGGIVGSINRSRYTIDVQQNVVIAATISGGNVGGVVGNINVGSNPFRNVNINGVTITGNIRGTTHVGGIIGTYVGTVAPTALPSSIVANINNITVAATGRIEPVGTSAIAVGGIIGNLAVLGGAQIIEIGNINSGSNIAISGNINNSGTSSNVGGLIGNVGGSAATTLTVNRVTMGATIVGGTGFAGGIIGGVASIGSANTINIGNINIGGTTHTVTVNGSVSGSYAGGVIGRFSGSAATTVDINRTVVNSNVNGTINAGGIVGRVTGGGTDTNHVLNVGNHFVVTINGNISANGVTAGNGTGGVIGSLAASTIGGIRTVYIRRVEVSGSITGVSATGGVIGAIGELLPATSIININDTHIRGGIFATSITSNNPNHSAGGIIGTVVGANPVGGNNGHVVNIGTNPILGVAPRNGIRVHNNAAGTFVVNSVANHAGGIIGYVSNGTNSHIPRHQIDIRGAIVEREVTTSSSNTNFAGGIIGAMQARGSNIAIGTPGLAMVNPCVRIENSHSTNHRVVTGGVAGGVIGGINTDGSSLPNLSNVIDINNTNVVGVVSSTANNSAVGGFIGRLGAVLAGTFTGNAVSVNNSGIISRTNRYGDILSTTQTTTQNMGGVVGEINTGSGSGTRSSVNFENVVVMGRFSRTGMTHSGANATRAGRLVGNVAGNLLQLGVGRVDTQDIVTPTTFDWQLTEAQTFTFPAIPTSFIGNRPVPKGSNVFHIYHNLAYVQFSPAIGTAPNTISSINGYGPTIVNGNVTFALPMEIPELADNQRFLYWSGGTGQYQPGDDITIQSNNSVSLIAMIETLLDAPVISRVGTTTTITWDAVPGAIGYEISVSGVNGGAWMFISSAIYSNGVYSYNVIAHIRPAATQNFRVRALPLNPSTHGTSNPSNTVSFRYILPPPAPVISVQYGAHTATIHWNAVYLNWSAAIGSGSAGFATHYAVYRNGVRVFTSDRPWASNHTGAAESFDITPHLVAGNNIITVRSVWQADFNSPWSAHSNEITIYRLAAPVVTRTGGNSDSIARWNVIPNATGYEFRFDGGFYTTWTPVTGHTIENGVVLFDVTPYRYPWVNGHNLLVRAISSVTQVVTSLYDPVMFPVWWAPPAPVISQQGTTTTIQWQAVDVTHWQGFTWLQFVRSYHIYNNGVRVATVGDPLTSGGNGPGLNILWEFDVTPHLVAGNNRFTVTTHVQDPNMHPSSAHSNHIDIWRYGVTFTGHDDGAAHNVLVVSGGSFTLPEIINNRLPNQRFRGWYVQGDAQRRNPGFTVTNVTQHLTVTADWETLYAVTFVNHNDASVSNLTGIYVTQSFRLPTFSNFYLTGDRANQNFVGWWAPILDMRPGEPTLVWTLLLEGEYAFMEGGNLTISAVWSINVTFTEHHYPHPNHLNFTWILPSTHHTQAVDFIWPTISAAGMRPGHTHHGWGSQPFGEGPTFGTPGQNAGQPTGLNAHASYMAQWQRYAYHFTFTNHAQGTDLDEWVNISSTFTFPIPTATGNREGYRFDGWYFNNAPVTGHTMSVPSGTGDREFVAQWTRIHMVIFTNHDDDTDFDMQVPHGNPINVPSSGDLTPRAFLEFRGWRINGTGNIIQPGAAITSITADTNFVALWTPLFTYYAPVWNPSFPGNAVAVQEQRISITGNVIGNSITLMNPTTIGAIPGSHMHNALQVWEFEGWLVGGNLMQPGEQITGLGADVLGIGIHGQWVFRSFTITYNNLESGDTNTNPNTFGGGNFTEVGGVWGLHLANASRNGWNFLGWYTTPNFASGTRVTVLTAFQNHILYARWNQLVFNITFTNHDNGTVFNTTVNYGDSVTMPAVTDITARTLQMLRGWQINGTGQVHAHEATVTNITADTNFVAIWTPSFRYYAPNSNAPFTGPDVFVVAHSLSLNSGDGTVANHLLINPATSSLFDSVMAIYNFHGWYIHNGTQYVLRQPTFMLTAFVSGDTGISIRGSWSFRSFTITYNNIESEDTNTNPNSFTGNDFTEVGGVWGLHLANASRNGWNFLGWYTTSNFASGTRVTVLTAFQNHTLYARWQEIEYTLTFNNIIAGDTNTNRTTFTLNDLPFNLVDASRDGYAFLGWFTNAAFTGTAVTQVTAAGNQTFYARFVRNFTITYIGLPTGATNTANPTTFNITNTGYTTFVAPDLPTGLTFVSWQIVGQPQDTFILEWFDIVSLPLSLLAQGDLGTPGDSGSTVFFGGNLILRALIREATITYSNLHGAAANNPTGFYNFASNQYDGLWSFRPILPHTLVAPANRAGFSFAGWYSTSTFDIGTEVTEITEIGIRTIWARWNVISFTITYNNLVYTYGGHTFTGTHSNPATFTINNFVNHAFCPIADDDLFGMELLPASRAGWTFLGWYTSSNFASNTRIYVITQLTNHTLYARWQANNFTIQYNSNIPALASNSITGSTANSNHVFGAGSGAASNGFSLLGWTFQGWATTPTGTITFVQPGDNVDLVFPNVTNGSTVTLYARWAANEWLLTFVYNDATSGYGTPSMYVIFDGQYGWLPEPEKTGYTFGGWWTHDGTGGNWGTEILTTTVVSINSNHNAYARWNSDAFLVRYNANQPSNASRNVTGTMANSNHMYGTASALRNNTFALEGWVFMGWATTPTGSVVYQNGATILRNFGDIPAIDGDIVDLYAVWQARNIIITFSSNIPATASNSIVGTMGQSTHAFDTASNLANNQFTLAHWQFVGWSFNPSHMHPRVPFVVNGASLAPTIFDWALEHGSLHTDEVSLTLTLYAIWRPTTFVMVEWNYNGADLSGDIEMGRTVMFDLRYDQISHASTGAILTAPTPIPIPSRTGFTFAGWWTQDGTTNGEWGTEVLPSTMVTTTDDHTLHARWTPIPYTLTFNNIIAGDTNTNRTTFTINDLPFDLVDASRDGYAFLGWFTNAAFTGNAVTQVTAIGNQTFYARFVRNFTITYTLVPDGATNNDPTTFNVTTGTILLAQLTNLPTGWEHIRWEIWAVSEDYLEPGWFSLGELHLGLIAGLTAGSVHHAGFNITVALRDAGLQIRAVIRQGVVTYNNLQGATHTNPTQLYSTHVLPITLATPTDRTGWNFIGWFNHLTAGTEVTQITAFSNQTIYARWQAIEYTLTFNNIIAGDTNTNRTTFTINDLPFDLVDASRDGYAFLGWFTNAAFTGTAVTQVTAVGNQTFYARFVRNFTISYVAYHGNNRLTDFTFTPNNPTTYNITTLHTTFADPTNLPNGWQFFAWEIWAPSSDYGINEWFHFISLPLSDIAGFASNQAYDNGQFVINTIMRNAGLQVRASVVPIPYNLTFNNVVASEHSNPSTFNITQLPFNLSDASRVGHTFRGWYTTSNFAEGTRATQVTAIGHQTFYARWTVNEYTISFNTHGGTAVSPITQDFGTAVTQPADPTREGFTFLHWSLTADGTAFTFPTTMPAGGLTLHAVWGGDYSITWFNRDGTVLLVVNANRGAVITPPATVPYISGYRFVRWDGFTPGMLVLGDHSFTAVYEEYPVELFDIS